MSTFIPIASARPYGQGHDKPHSDVEKALENDFARVDKGHLKEESTTSTRRNEASTSSGNAIVCKKGSWLLAAIVIVIIIVLICGTILVLGAAGIIGADEQHNGSNAGGDSSITETVKPLPQSRSPAPSVLQQTIASTNPPSQTQTPIPDNCQPLFDKWDECLNEKLDIFATSACSKCIVDYIESDTTDPRECLEWTEDFCLTIAAPECQCSVCIDATHDILSCYLEEDDCVMGDCPGTLRPTATVSPTVGTPTPEPEFCAAETEAYQTCYWTLPDGNDELCVDCINNIINSTMVVTCEDYNQQFCSQLSNDCEVCGWCRDELVTWADCVVGRDQCNITCDSLYSG